MDRAVRAVVRGRVQGVGFRFSAVQRARVLGVRGWVRNRPDGAVECWLEGPAQDVAGMLEWLAEGPPYAAVAGVETSEQSPAGFTGFEVTDG